MVGWIESNDVTKALDIAVTGKENHDWLLGVWIEELKDSGVIYCIYCNRTDRGGIHL